MDKLNFTFSPEDGHYSLTLGNTFCGTLEVDVDGYYYYLPQLHSLGYYPGWFLKCVGEKLIELNEPWDKELREAQELLPNSTIQKDAFPEFNFT